MADVSNAMERLAKAAPKLNAATDAANTVFKIVEDNLTKLSLGIEAEIQLSSKIVPRERNSEIEMRDGAVVEETTFLAYTRVGNRYRIAISVARSTSIGDDQIAWTALDPVAWDQASRAEKLAAVQKLPMLIEELAKEAEALSAASEAASEAVSKIIKGMKN